MSNSNILHGPAYSSSTFEEELEATFLDEFLVNANKRRRSNKLYLIDASTNEKLTSTEFIDQSYNVAAKLQALGCNRNDGLVGILSENRLDYPIVILGTLLTGAAVICYNVEFTTDELRREFQIFKPKVLFCSPKHYNNLKQTAPQSTIIIVFDSKKSLNTSPYPQIFYSQLSQSTRAYQNAGPRSTDDLAFVLYTSGTTGRPKGVMLTHKNMVYMLKILTDENVVEVSGEMSVSVAPMFHAYGLITLLLAIPVSVTFVIMPTFDEKLFLSTIEAYKMKQLSLVPTMIIKLLKDANVNECDLSSLESVLCGDAPLKIETEKAFKEKFGLKYFQQGYGMTECTLITTIKRVENTKPGSCGSVIPGAQLKIVDLTTREALGKNEIGEICIKGPHVMMKYFGIRKEASYETLDEEGWLYSGDIGYYDEDEELFVIDRAKQLIKYKGFQVASAELEALLLTHPKIADCGVIDVLPDDDGADKIPIIIAYVVKEIGAEVTEQEIIELLEGSVLLQKTLKAGVVFVSKIPKTVTGKILHYYLHKFWKLKRSVHPSIQKKILLDFV